MAAIATAHYFCCWCQRHSNKVVSTHGVVALVASEVLLTARTFIGDDIGGTVIMLTTPIRGQL
ncbi:hypothetical protein FC16_GL001036 [Loigolactobacillus coryniformis subsp. torquens DSM 20004 = KCTC 3535]|nr:hypothetical protein FC16_GL001036 [Loigolactobacillus coryniformis subsp. torquens DSM 20004 = KCTC 3535]